MAKEKTVVLSALEKSLLEKMESVLSRSDRLIVIPSRTNSHYVATKQFGELKVFHFYHSWIFTVDFEYFRANVNTGEKVIGWVVTGNITNWAVDSAVPIISAGKAPSKEASKLLQDQLGRYLIAFDKATPEWNLNDASDNRSAVVLL